MFAPSGPDLRMFGALDDESAQQSLSPSQFLTTHYRLAATSALASVLLSVWLVYADPIVNNDGIQYFRVASKLLEGEWRAAVSIHHWPFYSLLIAFTSQLTGLDVELSAHALNAVLYALTVLAFVTAVAVLGGNRRTLVIAALLILFLPALNKYRSFVIRDAGYLTFYLWSLVFLFWYWQRPRLSSLIGWFVCSVTAVLFRIEGLAFLLLVPAMLLVHRYRASSLFRLAALGVFVAIAVSLFAAFSLWTLASELGVQQAELLTQPLASLSQAWDRIGEELWFKLHAVRQEFLGELSGKYAYAVLFLTLVAIVGTEIVKRLSVIYAGLFVHGVAKGLAFPVVSARDVWMGLIIINVLILLVFALVNLFVTGRYTMGLVLTMMLAVPFSMSHLFDSWLERRTSRAPKRWVFPAIVILCVAVGIKGLDRFTDKRYLRTAGYWIAQHSAPQDTLYSNNRALIYYSGKRAFRDGARYDWSETMGLVWRGDWKKYDYLAVQISHERPDHEQRLVAKLGIQPVKVFHNRKGDRLLVFKVHSEAS